MSLLVVCLRVRYRRVCLIKYQIVIERECVAQSLNTDLPQKIGRCIGRKTCIYWPQHYAATRNPGNELLYVSWLICDTQQLHRRDLTSPAPHEQLSTSIGAKVMVIRTPHNSVCLCVCVCVTHHISCDAMRLCVCVLCCLSNYLVWFLLVFFHFVFSRVSVCVCV